MALTNVKRGQNRRIYASRAKEGTFAGGATLNIVFNARRDEGSYVQDKTLSMMDSNTATGYENPTQQFHLGRDLPPTQIPLLAAVESLGWAFGFSLGEDAVSGTTNIVHSFTPIALPAAYPSFALEEHRDGATAATGDKLHWGVYITEWTLSGGRTGHANLDITVAGSGATDPQGNQTESGMVQPNRISGILPAQAFTIGMKAMNAEHDPVAFSYTSPTAAWTAANITAGNSWSLITEALESWSVTFRNVLVDSTTRSVGQGTSAGLIGSQPVIEKREVVVSLTFIDEPVFDDFLATLAAASTTDNLERSLGIEFVNDFDLNTTDFAGGVIHIPVMGIEAEPEGSFGAANTLSMTFVSKSATVGGDPVIRCFTHDATTTVYCQ